MAEENALTVAINDDELTLATIEKIVGTVGDYDILTFNRSIREQAEVKREAKQRKGLPLVLLDFNMPLLDGYTLFRNLRTNPEPEKIPVIIISGYELDKSNTAHGQKLRF